MSNLFSPMFSLHMHTNWYGTEPRLATLEWNDTRDTNGKLLRYARIKLPIGRDEHIDFYPPNDAHPGAVDALLGAFNDLILSRDPNASPKQRVISLAEAALLVYYDEINMELALATYDPIYSKKDEADLVWSNFMQQFSAGYTADEIIDLRKSAQPSVDHPSGDRESGARSDPSFLEEAQDSPIPDADEEESLIDGTAH